MEKKEIQEWRDKLIKMFGVYHSDGQEYVTCPLCGINLDELSRHMIEELDKAREEGRKELVEEIRKVIKKNIKIEDTEDKHYQIDKGIVKTLGDGEISKMWMGNEDDWKELDEDLYGGWGWYS